jgi:hypothetical protein
VVILVLEWEERCRDAGEIGGRRKQENSDLISKFCMWGQTKKNLANVQ